MGVPLSLLQNINPYESDLPWTTIEFTYSVAGEWSHPTLGYTFTLEGSASNTWSRIPFVRNRRAKFPWEGIFDPPPDWNPTQLADRKTNFWVCRRVPKALNPNELGFDGWFHPPNTIGSATVSVDWGDSEPGARPEGWEKWPFTSSLSGGINLFPFEEHIPFINSNDEEQTHTAIRDTCAGGNFGLAIGSIFFDPFFLPASFAIPPIPPEGISVAQTLSQTRLGTYIAEANFSFTVA